MADDDLYSLDTLARNQMTHYGPDPAAEEVGRRVRATGQNLYQSWFGPAERLGRLAMTGTLDTSNPQAVQDAFSVATWATGGRMPFARAGTLGTGGGKIRAYHASPYDFEKFSSEKIGTGQGAQSYGHGLYFAENPAVAEDYKRTLGNLSLKDRTGNDVPIRLDDQYILNELERADGDYDALIEKYKRQQADAHPGQYWSNYFDNRIGTLERWKALGATPQRAGKMYQVDISAEREHFLDWDKPMSQQHPNVQRALRELNMSPGPGVSAPELTGEQILTNMAARRGMTHEQVAQALRDAGIPGIRYFDQGSRRNLASDIPALQQEVSELQRRVSRGETQFQADLESAQRQLDIAQGKQRETRNYVVFNDQLVDIIKKYGIAGLIAAGAYSHQDQGQ